MWISDRVRKKEGISRRRTDDVGLLVVIVDRGHGLVSGIENMLAYMSGALVQYRLGSGMTLIFATRTVLSVGGATSTAFCIT